MPDAYRTQINDVLLSALGRVLAGLADRGALAGLAVQGATLEDVFLDLTGREYRA